MVIAMNRLKTLFLVILAIQLISATAYSAEYKFNDSLISSLAIPDDFSAYTEDACDQELETLLKRNKFTLEQWQKEVMEPSGYKLYAMNIKENKYIYLACNENTKSSTNNDDISAAQRLMQDYKLIDGNEDKNAALKKIEDALKSQGINKDNIETLQWVSTGDDYSYDYIEYICYSGSEYFHCFETVYNAYKIELQFTSQNAFTDEEKAEHLNVLKSLKYDKEIDYAEAKKIIDAELQKKLEEETHNKNNTKILRTSMGVTIVSIALLCICLAVRIQYKKRRNNS